MQNMRTSKSLVSLGTQYISLQSPHPKKVFASALRRALSANAIGIDRVAMEITTKQLLLRDIDEKDLEAFHRLQRDSRTTKFT